MKIPPAKPWFPEEDLAKILDNIKSVMQSGMLTLHKVTREFESNYAEYCGTKFAIAVNSGTGAVGNHTHTFTTSGAGSSGSNANLPPYIGIQFIIKT